jgi:hypothetical protein
VFPTKKVFPSHPVMAQKDLKFLPIQLAMPVISRDRAITCP